MSSAATKARKDRTFSRESYVAHLMAELNHTEICHRIAVARKQTGLGQKDFAELLAPPMSYRTIQTWESVKDPVVPWDRLDEIARLTRVTKEWLLHGDERVMAPERSVILSELAELRQLIAGALRRLDGGEPPRAPDE